MMNRSAFERKAILLRVGVDTTEIDKQTMKKTKYPDRFPDGGFLGPFKNDGEEFEFIPIPENKMFEDSDGVDYEKSYLEAKIGELSYGKLQGIRINRPMIETIKEIDQERALALKDVAVHWDPDFANMTYGDAIGKGIQGLQKNDLLVFCASLRNQEKKEDYGLFIIGYFTLKQAPFYFQKMTDVEKKGIVQEYKDKNAHFSKAWARVWNYREPNAREKLLQDCYESEKWNDCVLTVGDDPNRKSGLLTKAIRITDPKPKWIQNPGKRGKRSHYYIILDWAKALGLTKKQRLWEIGTKSIEGKRHVENLIERMEEGRPFHAVCPPSM